ncbi:hypothetical protein WOLCODRAFT_135149 [Wolfiporia cocos MD-104 SS10]|uniref:Methyltransferase domain-containing protein n=1 Tax=Wolfiporia cocos (strain MD-104) TaxID=742152 RepID=A0A2H3IU07_WOLCO|nr:hypothetical protein WOLCODRAFT_135149 [Wolfiporia cocos MD-104 SS10]
MSKQAEHGKDGTTFVDDEDDIPLDEVYSLNEQDSVFFKSQTGIQDEAELKQHILKVQADALAVHPYPCIRYLSFTRLVISRMPAYEQLLKLGRERQNPLFLDIGCCFGNDLRKAVADGFPVNGAIGSDLHPEYWQLGHQLFRTTKEQFPAHFIPGDALSPEFLEPVPPFYAPPTSPVPDLSSLTTLTPLHGHISAIHASSFFHLFDEATQLRLAKAVAGLLSPEPGSVIFGGHGGLPEKGFRDKTRLTSNGQPMFCHSPQTWIELWDGEVFQKGTVKMNAVLVETPTEKHLVKYLQGDSWYHLVWSVTRL